MRLIDADKLLERMKKGMESGSNLNGTFDLYIEHAPTVKPNGDLISRQDAIDAIREIQSNYVPYKIPEDVGADIACNKIIKMLNEFPSADRPKGKWVLTPMLPDNHRYKCSNCMRHHRERYDFCPSCGSRMLGEDGE